MSLLDDMRERVRVSTDMTDGEIEDLIYAAIEDMRRCGVKDALLSEDDPHPLVKQAVSMYVRAYYGLDNAVERPQFIAAYERVLCDLLNSASNEYLFPEEEGSDDSDPSDDDQPDDGSSDDGSGG